MIPLFKVYMSKDPSIWDTLHSGYITQGPKVDEFEKELGSFLGTSHVVTVNSGTSALQLAVHLIKGSVRAPGIFISTAMTCSATNTAIIAAGGQIIWADVDPHTGNICPDSVGRLLRKHGRLIKGIMGVDWAGHPCEWEQLNELAGIHGVATIEDAAHAFGSVDHKGDRGQFVCYSFQAIKTLTTIDGGALIPFNYNDYVNAKLLRWFGIDREGPLKDFRCSIGVPEPGFKYHMNDVNATVGLMNLPRIAHLLRKNKMNAKLLRSHVLDSGLGSARRIINVGTRKDYAPWIFTILTDDRDEFIQHMKARGIAAGQVHARNDTMTCFRSPYVVDQDRDLSGLEEFSSRQVNIPCGWWLTPPEIHHIGTALKDYALKGVGA